MLQILKNKFPGRLKGIQLSMLGNERKLSDIFKLLNVKEERNITHVLCTKKMFNFYKAEKPHKDMGKNSNFNYYGFFSHVLGIMLKITMRKTRYINLVLKIALYSDLYQIYRDHKAKVFVLFVKVRPIFGVEKRQTQELVGKIVIPTIMFGLPLL